MAITTGITIEEFECLPDALAKNRELVNGELVDLLVALLIPAVEPAAERQAILSAEQPFESPLIPGFSMRLAKLFDRAEV